VPIEVSPNRIELSDLTGGYTPDPSEAAIPTNAAAEALNLLPEPWGNELRLRAGFSRIASAARISTITTHWIRQVYYYEVIDSGTRKRYLMCVLTNNTDAAQNNIQIWAYDLVADTFTRVDTADRQWAKAKTEHWGAVIEGTFYGGTRGELPYRWHPTNGWSASPTTPSADTWVDSIAPGAGEKARNYAFKKGSDVVISGTYYKAARGIRYKTWESGQRYSKGERVSNKVAIGGQTYWRSWECILSHTAAAGNSPGDGADTATYWKARRLANVKNADSELTDDWFYNPVAGKTSVGAYHGNRLWLRRDDNDNWARLQYSAPAKPERDALIADLDWDPKDWAAVDDNEGDGGGWLTVPFSGKGDSIRALQSFGNYLIIAGRWQSYVLSGTNESTWTLRKLGDYGSVGPKAICELDGLVYQLGRHGVLTVTDGTSMQPVPGMEKARKWMKDQLDDSIGHANNAFPTLLGHDGRLWISMPDPSAPTTSTTIVYDPRTASWWELDLRIMDMAKGEDGGTERLFFSTDISALGGAKYPTMFQYKDDPGNEVYTDDDQNGGSATTTADISWHWRSAWFQFGTTRNERRLRRAWALVGGEAAQSVIVRLFRNFNTTYRTTTTRTLTGQATQEAEFVEAQVGQGEGTYYAAGIRVSGTANAVTSLHGVGIDTEPVRSGRFHK
jgi:hypothetical protein